MVEFEFGAARGNDAEVRLAARARADAQEKAQSSNKPIRNSSRLRNRASATNGFGSDATSSGAGASSNGRVGREA